MSDASRERAAAEDRSRPVEDGARRLLDFERERAERRLNVVRAAVLGLLVIAALVYAPSLTPALNWANALVLVPALLWTVVQQVVWYRQPHLPGWLALVNPLVDITAVTAITASYGVAQSAVLALQSPVFLIYVAVIAARPITSSTRNAAIVSALAVTAYGALTASFILTGRVHVVLSPVDAAATGSVSLLDEGSKLLLLAVAGAIATYATVWQERMATSYYREAGARERLEARLAQAQLQSLKLQIHPHFLFNTLNSIAALIGDDPAAAERMITGLSDFLRLSLRNVGEQEVPLERELEILGHYLAIQSVRFEGRLHVVVDAERDVLRASVPNLLLQPLVENAIRHGIAPRASGGSVHVEAHRSGDRFYLRVTDDGVGPAAPIDGRGLTEGTGLANTRARLEHLYGAAHRFRATGEPGRGFTVDIELPYHVR